MVDAEKATEIAIQYLERIYGNLNMTLFRIEQVKENINPNHCYVLCSLITSLGSSKRTYYYIKVDLSTKKPISIHKGFRNESNQQIEWKNENLPPEEKE